MARNYDYLIRYAAIEYLNQWYIDDRIILGAIARSEGDAQLGQAIRSLAAKYRVSRNFPLKKLRESEGDEAIHNLWTRVASAVSQIPVSDPPVSTAETVSTLAVKLGTIFPRKEGHTKPPVLLSAASKFLWFMGHNHLPIYDSRALSGLPRVAQQSIDDNYPSFQRAWESEFKNWKDAIVGATGALESQLDWSIVPPGMRSDAKSEMRSKHFAGRVFDKLLWTIGGEGGDDAEEDGEDDADAQAFGDGSST